MRRYNIGLRRAAALLLILMLFLTATPAGLAEGEKIVIADKGGVTVYNDPALSSYAGTFPQFTVMTQTAVVSGIAQVRAYGKIYYMPDGAVTELIEGTNMQQAVVNVNTKGYLIPSTSSASINLKAGTPCDLVAVNGNWALIQNSGIGAYVYSGVVTATGAQPAPTVAPTATPMPEVISETFAVEVTLDGLPVYKTPSDSGVLLGKLPQGLTLTVTAYAGEWAYVGLNGNHGFARIAGLRRVSETPTAAPTVAPTPAPAQPSGTVPATPIPAVVNIAKLQVYEGITAATRYLGTIGNGTRVNVVEYGDYWARIELNGNYGYCMLSALTPVTNPTPTPAPATPQTAIQAVVNIDKLYVFEGKTGDTRCLGWLKRGETVGIVETGDYWARIEKNGAYGYCLLAALTVTADIQNQTPAQNQTSIETPTVDPFEATVVTAGARFYQSASASSANVAIPRGTTVVVGGFNSEWACVRYNGVIGYMRISDLNRNVYTTLSSGATGNPVTVLESMLLNLGFFDARPGTTYSAYTEAAVKRMQAACGLPQTGVADETFQRILYSGAAPSDGILGVTLAKGSKGDSVGRVQLRLYALGYLSKTSSIDSDFGTITNNAVTLFKQAAGLGNDGNVDAKTMKALYSTSAPTLPSGKSAADNNVVTGGAVQINPGNQQNNSTSISSALASTQTSYSAGMSGDQKLEYAIYVGQNQLGKPYVYGANGTSSYDCTGFTCYCFKQIGVSLQRTAVNQGYDEKYPKVTSAANLKRGDLVYFNTISDSDLSDHAGIYLGGGFFMHASSGQGKVVISTLTSGYYQRVFSWGRRVF